MSLDTLIAHSLLNNPSGADAGHALVLMGGGARTAYQAGALQGIAHLLASQGRRDFPFRILIGTSAGALNATFLAGQALHGLSALERLAGFWQQLRSEQIYRLQTTPWLPPNLLLAGMTLMRQVRHHRALLDTMPLVDTLHRHVDLEGVEAALRQGTLDALAVTASSYTTGDHWTFYQTRPDNLLEPWLRPGRRSSLQPITIEHLMASSAIPFLFPAVPLWVDGHKEFFGDGSMRQLTPLSPALHLGARKILVIGVGQPRHASRVAARKGGGSPTAGTIAGHAMASVFHDTLQADVEQAQRVSQALAALPAELQAALPYRPLNILALQPSQSLDELALEHVGALPLSTRHTLDGLGVLNTESGAAGSAAAVASYLLFESSYVNALLDRGERDAMAHRDELLAFFDTATS